MMRMGKPWFILQELLYFYYLQIILERRSSIHSLSQDDNYGTNKKTQETGLLAACCWPCHSKYGGLILCDALCRA